MTVYMDSLLRYFPGHAAEDEQKVLSEVFVPSTVFSSIKNFPLGQPRLVIGAKGSGKSAIAFRILSEMEGKFPRVFLKPQLLPDSDDSDVDESVGVDVYARRARIAIVKAIAAAVGAKVDGQDRDEYEAVLREAAVDAGKREHSIMKRVTSMLASVLGAEISASAVVPDFRSAERLIRMLTLYLEKENGKLYVVMDETDDYRNTGGSLSGLWGLLTAIRQLAQECVRFRFVVTLRSQVWSRLKRDKGGQFNQIGQFEPYCAYLSTNRASVGKILDLRVQLARDGLRLANVAAQAKNNHPLWPFFQPETVNVNWTPAASKAEVTWRNLLITQARCPRDTVMLVNSLARRCSENSIDRIGQDQLNHCITSHSVTVIEEMAREYASDFEAIQSLINSLCVMEIHFVADDFRAHLLSFIDRQAQNSPVFRGNALEKSQESVIALWSLLFELGVVIARQRDETQQEGYRHLFFDDDPDLVSIYRWDEMIALRWEIHAVVRPALNKLANSRWSSMASRAPQSFIPSNTPSVEKHGKGKRRR